MSTPLSSLTSKTLFLLMPLLTVIFLDVAGIVLVLPILTPLILQPTSDMVPLGTSLIVRDFVYGLSLAIFPFFMFFSTPILGDLSDKFGRKKILILCLLGSAVSYFIAAMGIIYNNILLILISRAVAGLAAGTQPIAIAAIIDLSTSQTKTKHLAWVVFASSLGLIFGPAIGGITADNDLISWFGYDTPFIVATAVCLLNALLLQFSFKEIRPVLVSTNIQFTKGFKLFMAAFIEKKFRLLALLYFCFTLAWSLYFQTINWLFMEKYHYSVGKLGLFVAFIGIIFALTSSIMVRLILNLFTNENKIFIFFVFLMAIANFGAAYSYNEMAQWGWVILNAASEIICFTLILGLFSSSVDLTSQGWIMGVTNALAALTWTVGGLINGPIGYINIYLPLWIAGFLCLISFTLMIGYQKKYYKS